jgi:hypothetical protein
MDAKLTYGASLILGILAMVLFIANVSLIESNHHMQDEISQRQAEITRSNGLGGLYQNLVQALADASMTYGDTQIRELLSSNGITIKPKGTAAAEAKEPKEPKEAAPKAAAAKPAAPAEKKE